MEQYVLFEEYFKELEGFMDKKNYTNKEVQEWFWLYHRKNCYEWINIYYANQIVGFLVIELPKTLKAKEKLEITFGLSDYFIAQSYIKKDYRRKNLMSSAVKQYVKQHPGKYGMIWLKRNAAAHKFWKHVFQDIDYTQTGLKLQYQLNPDEMSVGFEPKKVCLFL